MSTATSPCPAEATAFQWIKTFSRSARRQLRTPTVPLKRGCAVAGSIADHIEQHGVVPCGHYAASDTAMLRKQMMNKRGHSGFPNGGAESGARDAILSLT